MTWQCQSDQNLKFLTKNTHKMYAIQCATHHKAIWTQDNLKLSKVSQIGHSPHQLGRAGEDLLQAD